ncbi:MAG: haloacid dehalogenase-like hydrolase [Verrucomicrobia bacterium]|nr:haloacid dehalogenase-like hydrolase [Verrucomicrobiota bacterium]
MVIGVDFDNTIVSYDALFHRIAVERGLIPSSVPVDKTAVRDHLRSLGGEEQWTALQGLVYGPRIREAAAFPGVKEFFAHCRRARLAVHIVSHKTRQPVLGPPHDLHAAASGWLEQAGFFDAARLGLPRDHVHFGITRQEKIVRIRALGCTTFIDDLEEVFSEPEFPAVVEKILFAPQRQTAAPTGAQVLTSWAQIENHVFARAH